LAELVFVSQQGETSSGIGTKQVVEAHGTEQLRREGTRPIARRHHSPSPAGLSPVMVGNGGGLEMLSWGFALQHCTACEDQESWCPKELALPQAPCIY